MPPATKQQVLIVEDDVTLASMYQKKFELEGYAVTVAADGEAGITAAKASTPMVILLDIIMPKMDGFATLQALKEDATTKAIPVILLTNLGQNEDVAKGTKLGAIGYLIKAQLTPGEVVTKVRELLGKKR